MSRPTSKALQLVQEFSLPLIAGVVAAVMWSNLDNRSYHAFIHYSPLGHHSHFNFHFLMNDIFMAFFFGLAAKEITEAVLPGGALNPPRKAVNPLLGTLGGVFGPIGVYFGYVAFTGHWEITNGWGIPTATDIALAWLVARIVFGAAHPAVSFLLLLAVADDGIGLGIIAIFYPDPENPVQPIFLLLVLAAMGVAYGLQRLKVTSWQPYVLVPGVMSFFGLFWAHLHPALALVPVVPFMPSAAADEGLFVAAGPGQTDTLNRFEHTLKLPVDVGLFGFGLANAGVEFSSMGPATWAVLIGLMAGKTLGIFGLSALGHFLGFRLPEGMSFAALFVAGMVAALGLTVALFVAGVAFTDPSLQGAAKMGALFSAGVAPVAILAGKLLGVGQNAQAKSIAPPPLPARAEG
jgi:Na+:H+ antiporter, NhaA family